MIKRIFNLMQQDFTNALRDNLVVWIMVAPLVLAVAARFFLPSLEDIKVRFALLEGLDPAVSERIASYGVVETFETREALEARVLHNDDVIGVAPGNDGLIAILEGNEQEGEEFAQVVLTAAQMEGNYAEFKQVVRGERSLITEYGAIIMILFGIMLGTLVSGMNLVHDKETSAIKALGVSPLSLLEYTLARGLFGFIASLVLVVGSTLILLGGAPDYLLLIVGFVASFGIGIVYGYGIGGFADTQIQAMAIIKIVGWVFISIPLLSIFVPRTWHFLFYVLPNYWMFIIFENVLVGQIGAIGFWGACGLTIVSSAVVIAIMVPFLRKRIKLS